MKKVVICFVVFVWILYGISGFKQAKFLDFEDEYHRVSSEKRSAVLQRYYAPSKLDTVVDIIGGAFAGQIAFAIANAISPYANIPHSMPKFSLFPQFSFPDYHMDPKRKSATIS